MTKLTDNTLLPRPQRHDGLTDGKFDDLNKLKQERQKDTKVEPTPEPIPEETKDENVTLTKETIEGLIKAAQADSAGKLAQAEQELADARKQIAEAAAQVDASKADAATKDSMIEKQGADLSFVDGLFKQFGFTNPTDGKTPTSVYLTPNANAMDTHSAGLEIKRLFDSAKSHQYYEKNGMPSSVMDTAELTKFWQKYPEQTRDYFEAKMKERGFLRGSTDATTQRTDLPEGFLTYLSSNVRETHSPQFIFWQFLEWVEDVGKSHGDTVVIPRFNYGDQGTTKADWALTPGTPIDTARQPISEGSISIQIKEWGMGKVGVNNRPIAIPEFWLAHSMLGLESVVQRNLGQNYYYFEEISTRVLWEATTKVRYNNRGGVVPLPTGVLASTATANSGICTYQFLVNLYADMSNAQIIPFPDGCYGIVLPAIQVAQLKLSLNANMSGLNFLEIAELSMIFNNRNRPMAKKVNGYEGTFANFHIFSTNNYGVGAAGQPGVQTETINAVAQTTRTGFGFGANSIAKATGIPFQIRQQINTDFNRSFDWTWVEHCEFAQLDVDNAIGNQQTRVYQLRFTDFVI